MYWMLTTSNIIKEHATNIGWTFQEIGLRSIIIITYIINTQAARWDLNTHTPVTHQAARGQTQ